MERREKLLEWAKLYCNNPNLKDEGAFSIVLDKLEEYEKKDLSVKSESISRYSASYTDGIPQGTLDLLATFKKVRFL